eukprot:scaffold137410_cov22-Tisochrysis_lutea.AAC.3
MDSSDETHLSAGFARRQCAVERVARQSESIGAGILEQREGNGPVVRCCARPDDRVVDDNVGREGCILLHTLE